MDLAIDVVLEGCAGRLVEAVIRIAASARSAGAPSSWSPSLNGHIHLLNRLPPTRLTADQPCPSGIGMLSYNTE
jgi:hypothetical protein